MAKNKKEKEKLPNILTKKEIKTLKEQILEFNKYMNSLLKKEESKFSFVKELSDNDKIIIETIRKETIDNILSQGLYYLTGITTEHDFYVKTNQLLIRYLTFLKEHQEATENETEQAPKEHDAPSFIR